MKKPYASSRLAKYLDRRVLELRPKKSQADIAALAGFANQNMITMLKQGSAKVPLDRVPMLAAAMEVDPRYLFRLALEQEGFDTQRAAVEEIFGAIVSRNEVAWLEALRDASGHSDPALTTRSRAALRGIFGK